MLTLGSMSLLCRSSTVSLLEVPQIQFIAGVRGPSSMHRDRGFSAGLGGDVGLGSFRAPLGPPRVERQFRDCQFILRCCRHRHLVERTYKNNNNNNTIWGGSVFTGGPTQSQLSRPMSSGHHISMEHRVRRKQLNSDTNASKKKLK